MFLVAYELRKYREQVKQINALGVSATLDERSLCESCRAKMTDPKPDVGDMFLDVTVDNRVVRNKLDCSESIPDGMDPFATPNWTDYLRSDLKVLLAFLKNEKEWKSEAGWGHPLQPQLPHIRKLLGLDAPKKDADNNNIEETLRVAESGDKEKDAVSDSARTNKKSDNQKPQGTTP